jgi:hypothetical protein
MIGKRERERERKLEMTGDEKWVEEALRATILSSGAGTTHSTF